MDLIDTTFAELSDFARSSLPTKHNLMLANSVAIFDADYRGEYIMQFFNYTDIEVKHEKYTRLAQMEFSPFYTESGKYGTNYIPEIEFVVDKNLYNNFAEMFPSER
jgi:dUTPase